jgi:GABA permease
VGDRVLVVATSKIGAEEVSEAIGDRFGAGAEVRVVATPSGLSRLDWLANAEDDARADAASRARDVAKAIPTDPVERRVGDTDPVQAIEDEIQVFRPDHIVILTRGDDETSWLEADAGEIARDRFDVPITHLVVS